ncbi:MAG: hypothetical protein R2739_08020 [Chitinophagales bacterium]|nr:hypothetical protein [Bacteroidota bacterium]
MKKTLFIVFAIAAGFVATTLSGCSDDGTKVDGCNEVAGLDTGGHLVYIGDLNPGLDAIRDSLTASVSGSNVTIHSTALGRTLTGTIDASDCNKINLDSVIFQPGDTLSIVTSSLPVPGGVVKIWGIRGDGTGTITSTGSTTRIDIKEGHTNISSPLDLTNLKNLGLNLRGTFLNVN